MPVLRNKFPKGRAVSYRELRPELRHGDLILCSGRGIFSTMIRRATNSVWSHVGFILRADQVDRVMLLESVEPIGVRTVRLSQYLHNYDPKGKPYFGGIVVVRHKHFEEQVDRTRLKRLAQFAVDQFGYQYDRTQIAARILASIVQFDKAEEKRITDDRKAFICSDYVAKCFDRIKLHIDWDTRGFIAPADFATSRTFELVGILQRPTSPPPR